MRPPAAPKGSKSKPAGTVELDIREDACLNALSIIGNEGKPPVEVMIKTPKGSLAMTRLEFSHVLVQKHAEQLDSLIASSSEEFWKLIISQTDLEQIPRSVGDKHALETLFVTGSQLDSLPACLDNLELKHADFTGNLITRSDAGFENLMLASGTLFLTGNYLPSIPGGASQPERLAVELQDTPVWYRQSVWGVPLGIDDYEEDEQVASVDVSGNSISQLPPLMAKQPGSVDEAADSDRGKSAVMLSGAGFAPAS